MGSPTWPLSAKYNSQSWQSEDILIRGNGEHCWEGLLWVSQVGDNLPCYCSPGNSAAAVLCQHFSELHP